MNRMNPNAATRSRETILTSAKVAVAGGLLLLAGCSVGGSDAKNEVVSNAGIGTRPDAPSATSAWGNAPTDPRSRPLKHKATQSAAPVPSDSVTPRASVSPSVSAPAAGKPRIITPDRNKTPDYGYVITDDRQNPDFPKVNIYSGMSTESSVVSSVPSGTRFLAACIDFSGSSVVPRPGDGEGPATTTWLGVRNQAEGAIHYVSDAYARTESEAMRSRLPDCQ